jgi:hypothetical protein
LEKKKKMEISPVLPVSRVIVDIVDPLLEKLEENLTWKKEKDLENGGIIYLLVTNNKYTRVSIAKRINKSVHWVCR